MLTPRVLASAVLAKTQVLAAGGAYLFMFNSPGSWSGRQSSGWGGYEKTSSDAFDYALYSRLKKDGSIPSWANKVWLMEYDVAWTGNLPHILTARFPPDAGFIGYHAVNASILPVGDDCPMGKCELWQHTEKRTWPERDGDVFAAQGMLLRLDVRLLDSLVTHYEHKEWLFNEAAGATVCVIGEADWCTVDWGFKLGHPSLGWSTETNSSAFCWNYHMHEAEWVATLRGFEERRAADPGIVGRLYHALKF
ncbi:MAG: hypothetical protein WDW36_009811 [Sanguina aurantia]